MNILVVDDHRSARKVLKQMLSTLAGVEITEAANVEEALASIERAPPDLLLLDIRLSDDIRDRGGLDVLRRTRAAGRTMPAVMVTTSTEVAEIRQAMRLGAQDYVLKDELSPEMLLPIVEGLRERMELRGQVVALKQRVDKSFGVSAIVGTSPPMDRLRRLIHKVADAGATVLIRGETGTGKELVARALHEMSSRSAHPFLPINCSTFPGTLIESMIFGHEKGAFTGADKRQRGQFELAGAGTVLLDEIAEMPMVAQTKLLRVLEDRMFRPLGSEIEIPLRARVLAATHVDLEQRIAEGRFRQDLFYRLAVVSITVPPLAERGEDLLDLLASFTSQYERRLRFTDDAINWLAGRRWPGNVRELRNLVERLALLADSDVIDVETLEEHTDDSPLDAASEVNRIAKIILAMPERVGSKLRLIEKAVLHHAVETCGGNKAAAARLIGVDRKALERKWVRLDDGPPSSRRDEPKSGRTSAPGSGGEGDDE